MNRTLKIALVASLPVAFATGCSDWLSGPKLDTDPNRPSSATRDQLFVAMQAGQTLNFTGEMARTVAMWMQQMSGTSRQYTNQGLYQHTSSTFTDSWNQIYTGGGLVDLRSIQASAEADGDELYLGIAKVWEALVIGTAADIWGDIPYSEAATDIISPAFDDQAAVYAAVQSLLTDAIADIAAGDADNDAGPGSRDLFYGGDAAKWTELAHTLKARFYMHTAEVTPANYALALAEAQQGISSAANDFRTFHSSATVEQNIWHQFVFRERDDYIRAGKYLVDLLTARGDPRLTEYFTETTGAGSLFGSAPGDNQTTAANLNASGATSRGGNSFRQPLVTYQENQLIIAEAQWQAGQFGPARTALNNARAVAGLGPVATTLTGPALLNEIMAEKYIALFQNLEVWNDWKRRCYPNITPAPTVFGGAPQQITPARFFYGFDEINTNPNVPEDPVRNDNDPATATDPLGAACDSQN